MKIFIFILFSFFIFGASSDAKTCIANPPTPSVLPDSELISNYQKFENAEEQIILEKFHVISGGDVWIQFESCHHLTWTVVFLTQDPYISSASQGDRFRKLISRLFSIPVKNKSPFSEFRSRITSWASYSQKEESITLDKYFLWRRNEEMLSDIVLRQSSIGKLGTRTQIDLNISL